MWESLRPHFHRYETLWPTHIFPLRSPGSIYLRKGIDEDFETLAMRNHTTFVNVARAFQKIESRSEDYKFSEEIYANLQRAAEVVVATDDDTAIANLPLLDAVADTVGGRTAEKLIAKVKPGGVFASVLGAPQNVAKYPSVKVVPVFSKFDRKTFQFMAEAVRDGKLVIPISQKLPLSEAAEAQAAAEKGGVGKILLVA